MATGSTAQEEKGAGKCFRGRAYPEPGGGYRNDCSPSGANDFGYGKGKAGGERWSKRS